MGYIQAVSGRGIFLVDGIWHQLGGTPAAQVDWRRLVRDAVNDSRPLEAHLDAVESIDYALWVIFALDEPHRPSNKYLRWELDRHPLPEPWNQAHLCGRVQRILTDGDPESQRSLFRGIESTARTNGLGEVVDDWGIDLKLLHGDR